MSEDVVITSMNQFILETECPFIDDFEVLFQNKGANDSKGKFTINGYQFDTTDSIKKDFNHVTKWVEDKCRIRKIPIKNLKINMSWGIEYKDGGYQAFHCHGVDAFTVVFHFDGQPRIKDAPDSTYGMLYSIMPRADGTQRLQNHIPTRGKCLIMDGKVFHGVYPVKEPRRSIVIDFDYNWLDPDEKL